MSAPLRRLMKEAAELNTSPSPHFHAAPISDSNLFEWHFTLAGPPAPSAYAGGIYHGRIVLPPTYPLRPPSFRFLTPSGRFEVNREICLSISGHHEELWQPAWGIRTALLAIRSFMDGDAKGQVGGLDASFEARREYAGRSGEWVCEVCGRKNAVILGEWREECRAMGVAVDDEGDVPRGDRHDGGDGDADTTGVATSGEEAQQPRSGTEETKREEEEKKAAPVPSSSNQTATAATATVSPNPASPPPSSPSSAQQQQQQHLLPRNSNSPPAEPRASPLQAAAAAAAPPAVPATTTQAHSGSTSQSNSNGTPWLDRAIFGLFIALVVMILRRVARDE